MMAEFIPFNTEAEARAFIALCDKGFGYPDAATGTTTYAEPMESDETPGQVLVKCNREFGQFVANLAKTPLTGLERAQIISRYATRATRVEVRGLGF